MDLHHQLNCFEYIWKTCWKRSPRMQTKRQSQLGQGEQAGHSVLVANTILVVVTCALIQVSHARVPIPARKQDSRFKVPPSNLDDPTAVNRAPSRGKFAGQSAAKLNPSPWWEAKTSGRVEPSSKKASISHEQNEISSLLANSEFDDSKTIWPCHDNAVSCQFRRTCGRAELNPITKGHDRMIHGQNQTSGEWPSYVQLMIKHGYKVTTTSCGGTLVSDRHVLTAAHCVFLYDKNKGSVSVVKPQWLRAFFGLHDSLKGPLVQLGVGKKINLDPDYWTSPLTGGFLRFSDWAMIELAKPVNFTTHVQPACLPFRPINKSGKDSQCYMVGRGRIRGDKNDPLHSPTTQKLRVVASQDCETNSMGKFGQSLECFKDIDKSRGGACQEDSGGPVLCLDDEKRWTVAGVISSGIPCNEELDKWRGTLCASIRRLLKKIKTLSKF